MKKSIIFTAVLTAILAISCKGYKKINSPFDKYPPSSYYIDDKPCIDSLINEFGNPVFVYEDSDHVRTFVELMDTLLLINGYLAPEWRWSEEEIKLIINN